MNRCIIQNDKSLFGNCLTEIVKTGDHNVRIDIAFKYIRCTGILLIHERQGIEALTFGWRDFDVLIFRLPCIGYTGGQVEACLVEIKNVNLSLQPPLFQTVYSVLSPAEVLLVPFRFQRLSDTFPYAFFFIARFTVDLLTFLPLWSSNVDIIFLTERGSSSTIL